MMSCVKNPSPEDPDSLAFDVEERDPFQPPCLGPTGEKSQARKGEFAHSFRVIGRRRPRRQNLGRRRLGKTQELREEPPLGEQLVFHNLFDGARARVRPKRHVAERELAPDGDHLVRFARVGIEQMLEDGGRRPRYR
jgi:hypothetical protein